MCSLVQRLVPPGCARVLAAMALLALVVRVVAGGPSRSSSGIAPPGIEPVRGPWLQNAAVKEGAARVEVRWELPEPGRAWLELLRPGGTPRRLDSPFRGRMHRVALTGLLPGGHYRYRLRHEHLPLPAVYHFRAAPAAGRGAAIRFGVMGDFGAGTRGQAAVAAMLEREELDFVLLTGDLIYPRGEMELYDTHFFDPYRSSLPRMVFWPVLGNHDVADADGAAALAWFTVPLNGPAHLQGGRNYSFDCGDAHFVAIDSNAPAAVLQQQIVPWLEQDLRTSQLPWKIAFYHHPPYSSAEHGETPRMRDIIAPVLSRGGVAVGFGGHDHSYERTRPMDGVVYIVSGNGGNRLYRHRNPHAYTEVFSNQKHGLTVVSIDGSGLHLRHEDVDGKAVDELHLPQPPRPRVGG